MKYVFVTLSIIAIWCSIIAIVLNLNYDGVFLPVVGVIMTVLLFEIGFGERK